MRKIVRSITIILLVSIMFMISCNFFVCASQAVSVEVPIAVTVGGDVGQATETYVIKWQAEESGNPMPLGSVENVYTLTMQEPQKVTLPAITYSKTGIYTYTVWQEKGVNQLADYDSTVYCVNVYVTNAEDSEGLVCTVLAYEKSESKKLNEITFHNTYEYPPVEKPEDPPVEEKIDILIQTGQQNVPIPFLMIAGVIILIIGVKLLGKRNDNA